MARPLSSPAERPPGGDPAFLAPEKREWLPNSPQRSRQQAAEDLPWIIERFANCADMIGRSTYYDLCLALSGSPLRGPRGEVASALWRPLGEHLRANVSFEGNTFYVSSEEDGIIEAHLVAEGIRKIASLMHLIANGSLMKNAILFWDEPEANLNPRIVKIVADFLVRLAAEGVQIVIATHDYLPINELSLQAEYQTEVVRNAPIRFFSFYRNLDHSVGIEHGSTLADLTQNPIMEEFEALYNREQNLFQQQPPGT